ncbi:uncharacterized protein [Branchiostoma lanceolatum]|uniref:uncharacterized protein isoform X1 n=1 Tax=Branchiostoma lanceolatum TaxID=7740 RepID=UPI003453611C
MSVASIIVLFLVLETSFSTAAGCPGGFTKFRGACFKVYHQVASYDQAREFCANQGGHLAMPKDNSTDAFLMKLKNTVDPRGYFWFGLSDENWEGRWMWEDGTVLNKSAGWSNWREGQPDNHKGDEDCAHYNSVAMPGWNDLPCSDKVAKFICQTTDDAQTDSPNTTMTSLVTDQMGTSATQGSSGNLRKITFPAPRRVSNYAGLGTPLSQDLTSFTLCLHMRTDMSSYSHTSLVSYAVGSVQHANELLLFNDGGSGGRFELYVQNTRADLGALPVWDSGWHVICVTWRSSNGDWKLYADGAFRASGTGVNVGGKVRGGGTWILAQDQDTVGGSFVESQAFSGELSQVNLWDRVLTPEDIGTDWSVFCSHHGNVIDWATTNIQVVGQATSDQYRCQVTSTPASAERPRTTMTSLVTDQMGTPAPQGSPDCPKDYQPFQGICYKAYNNAVTFLQSLRACGTDGGTLAMPRDQKTNDFLITLKNSVDRKSPFRFGLHDRIKENVWRWMDGQELGDFTDWGPGEPNDASLGPQGEDCVEFYPPNGNKWNDRACSDRRKFICQADTTEHPGYTPVGQGAYINTYLKVFAQPKTYEDAKQACALDGGHLANVKTQALHDFLLTKIQEVDASIDYWIGLNDVTVENTWTWSDGTPVSDCDFTNWAPGEPNNAGSTGDQDCGQLWKDKGFQWDDDMCGNQKYFICQIGSGEETSCGRPEACSSGYQMHNGICYKAFNTPKNLRDASSTCAADGGTLAMPKDADTNAFLINLKNAVDNKAKFRFGLTDHHQEGGWMWVDNVALGSFRPWGPGQPDNAGVNEDCAEYFSGSRSSRKNTWNDGRCTDARMFICQVTPSATKKWRDDGRCGKRYPAEDGRPAECDPSGDVPCCSSSNWCGNSASHCHCRTCVDYRSSDQPRYTRVDYRYNKYFKMYTQPKAYEDAKRTCASDGGHLVDVKTQEVHAFLLTKIQEVDASRDYWIGLNDVTVENTWTWSDGTPVSRTFTNWAPGEPNNAGSTGDQDCGQLWKDKGFQWDDDVCRKQNYFICQIDESSYTRLQSTLELFYHIADCPEDYQPFQGICYKAYNTSATFQESLRVCGADGGTLAMPRDRKTNDFLITLKNSVDRESPFWFGLRDVLRENVWRWMDGQELGDFTDWGPGEPNDAFSGQGEDCAEYYPLKKNKWNDKACHYDRKFICQVDNTEAVRISSSSDGVRYDAKAVLESPVFSTNCSNNTLVFHYRMQGSVVPAKLHVSVVGNMSNSDSELLGTFPFKVTYRQTNRVHLDFHREQPFRVVFTVELDHSANSTGGAGQIHLYDVIVLNDKCRPTDESAAAGFFQEPTLTKGAIIGIIVVLVIVAVAIATAVKVARSMKRQHLRLMSTSTTVLMRRDNVMFEPDAE